MRARGLRLRRLAFVMTCCVFPLLQQVPRDAHGASVGGGQAGPTSIVGRVVSADKHAPVKRTIVRLSIPMPAGGRGSAPRPAGVQPRATESDDHGRFEFASVPPGIYNINAMPESGFVAPRRWRTIVAREGQANVVNFSLVRAGVIEGRVFDSKRGPLPRVQVVAIRYQARGGWRGLAAPMQTGTSSTDDRGRYRLFDLPPGDYFVSARPALRPGPALPAEALSGYAPTYYPGTTSLARARAVRLRPGREVKKIDVPLVPAPLASVTGTALDQQGNPLQPGSAISLLPRYSDLPGGQWNAIVRPDGSYTTLPVPPGEYHLVARMSGVQAREGAFVPIVVKGRNVTTDIRTNPGATISGTVRVEGGGNVARVYVAPRALPASAAAPSYASFGSETSVVVGSDGRFLLQGLRGMLTLQVNTSGAVLKSVLRGTEDVTASPFALTGTERIDDVSVVLTTETGGLEGVVAGLGDEELHQTVVVVFRDDPACWFPNSPFVYLARPATTAGLAPSAGRGTGFPADSMKGWQPVAGAFLLPELLPGTYRAVAVLETDPGDTVTADKSLVETLRARATEVVVTAGRRSAITLRVE